MRSFMFVIYDDEYEPRFVATINFKDLFYTQPTF